MKFDLTYWISQAFVVISYTLLIFTYLTKNRKKIIIFNFFALAATAVTYILLSAYTGLLMIIIAVIRNILLLKYDKEKDQLRNLIIVYILTLLSAIFTYTGISTILVVFSCLLYSYSIWQKDTRKYKILAIPISVMWIAYNFCIGSIFTIVFESLLLISAIIGLIRTKKVK